MPKAYRAGDSVLVDCPGCGSSHQMNTNPDKGRPCWGFNGDFEKPTFTPSVLSKSGHYCSGEEGKDCWCNYEARMGKPAPFSCYVCHSFIRDGRIEFLSDCTHSLAGKTVDLPEVEE